MNHPKKLKAYFDHVYSLDINQKPKYSDQRKVLIGFFIYKDFHETYVYY